jgi:hypothetical protein
MCGCRRRRSSGQAQGPPLILVLTIIAIILAVAAICFAVAFYIAQKRQGERIAISVMSTVDQIYRHIRRPEAEDYVEESMGINARTSPRFIRSGGHTRLYLDGWSLDAFHGIVRIRCSVEGPSGHRDWLMKQLAVSRESSFQFGVDYPSADLEGSTGEPGRYHVSWHATHSYELVSTATGERKRYSEEIGSVEDSFYVLP